MKKSPSLYILLFMFEGRPLAHRIYFMLLKVKLTSKVKTKDCETTTKSTVKCDATEVLISVNVFWS